MNNVDIRRCRMVMTLGGLASTLVLAVVPSASGSAATPSGVIHIYTAGTLASPIRPIVINGAFADAGTVTNKVVLTKGSIKIDISKPKAAEAAIYAHLSKYANPSTCAFSYKYTAPVKLLSGTGAYAGISGTVRVHNTAEGVLPRLKGGRCNESQNVTPLGFLSESQGSGRVSFK